jgi:alkaline phosphatase D
MRVSRRHLLALMSGAAAVACSPATPPSLPIAPAVTRAATVAPPPAPAFEANPFSLGVASGDPLPDGMVLWTRLAPKPLEGGGMPARPVEVRWEIASDEQFNDVIQSGAETATPEWAHSVHAEVHGLEPARWYWYRFKVGDETSAVGRTRTAPPLDQRLSHLRFAFASCQNWEHGYYTAHRHLAQEDLDLVLFLGDYMYESATREGAIRRHGTPIPRALDEYRNRYALYKSDADLQASHAAHPWVVTWDDHEVENDYAADVDVRGGPPEVFLKRRAAAYQAYWEHQPLRASAQPRGPDMLLYRRFGWGDLAHIAVLDTRQYRSDQVCGSGNVDRCAEAFVESRTMTGSDQERWLLGGLAASTARWNIIAQQVMMAQLDRKAGAQVGYNMDSWDGYPAARERILDFFEKRKPSNPVVLSGDIHSNWVSDLKRDFGRDTSPTVGTEFCCTSITSSGDGGPGSNRAYLGENPHIKYFGNQRGYVRCDVTAERWQTDFRIVPYVSSRGAPIETRSSWVIESGQPGAHKA